jgi:hypothetical protein
LFFHKHKKLRVERAAKRICFGTSLSHGLSYRNPAKVLESDMGSVAMWEKNRRKPKEPRLSQLLEILNCTLKTEYTKTSSEAQPKNE